MPLMSSRELLSVKKKHPPRRKDAPAPGTDSRRGKTTDRKPSDAEDVERAVYDGMQDLRVKKEPR